MGAAGEKHREVLGSTLPGHPRCEGLAQERSKPVGALCFACAESCVLRLVCKSA